MALSAVRPPRWVRRAAPGTGAPDDTTYVRGMKNFEEYIQTDGVFGADNLSLVLIGLAAVLLALGTHLHLLWAAGAVVAVAASMLVAGMYVVRRGIRRSAVEVTLCAMMAVAMLVLIPVGPVS